MISKINLKRQANSLIIAEPRLKICRIADVSRHSSKLVFDKFCKAHEKTPVLESFFLSSLGQFFLKKELQQRCFPVNFDKALTKSFL